MTIDGNGSARIAQVERRVLDVRGPDAARFLHGLCTQDVAALAPGAGRLVVFPNKKGRVVALAHHLQLSPERVLLVYEGSDLGPWLDDYLFADDVELVDASEAFVCHWLGGRGASGWLAARFEVVPPEAPWSFVPVAGGSVVRTFDDVEDGEGTAGYLVVREAGAADLVAGEGDLRPALVDAQAQEARRIAAGAPGAPGEVSERWNPLELALHDAISWTKGCYIGQEVIARIDNYGKQARHLVGVRCAPEASVAQGARILVGGEDIGEITSACTTTRDGEAVRALAMCRLPSPPDAPLEVEIVDGDGGVVRGELVGRAAAQRPHD